MPIYEYNCNNCGNCFEQLVFNSEDEKNITCGKCGSKKIKKSFSCFSSMRHVQADKNSGCSSGSGFS